MHGWQPQWMIGWKSMVAVATMSHVCVNCLNSEGTTDMAAAHEGVRENGGAARNTKTHMTEVLPSENSHL